MRPRAMTLIFDPAQHRYTVSGQEIPSVTSRIRDAGLMGSASRFYTAASAARGTAVHLACADHDLGRDVSGFLEGEHGGYLTSYLLWCRAMTPTWTAIEEPCYSTVFHTAGTPDRVGTLNGRPVVLDLKTGGRSPWHGVQLAMYSLIQYSDIPPRERRRLVLYLRENGSMAQSVEFSATHDFTQALTLCASPKETLDADDQPVNQALDTTHDDGPPPATGPRKTDA